MKGFLSDNASSVHPVIMESLMKANSGHAYPYGDDPITLELEKKMKSILGPTALTTVVLNGTGANVLGLSSVLDGYNSVLSVKSAHLNEDECGAFERHTGGKIITVPHENGKLNVELCKDELMAIGNFHHNQPKVISISQLTEFGSAYTIKELKVITDFAHKNGLLVHVDGARIANACIALNVSFKEMIVGCGLDLVSFGGTKNGLMYGELIVCFDEKIHQKLKFIRKQGMQLASKMRYISAQFLAYFQNDLCFKMAGHANNMCTKLYTELKKVEDIEFLASVDGNIIFAKLPAKVIKELHESQHFYDIDKNKGTIRLVTSFDTTEEDIDAFVHELKIAYVKNEDLND